MTERKIVTEEKKLEGERLAEGDRALLRAATTGEGARVLTEADFELIARDLQSRNAYIDEVFPRLVAQCPYETRLAVTAAVFRAICDHAREGGTFRYLIYDRLGFGPDAYLPLYLAGGMEISNEFSLREEKSGG